MKTPRLLSAVLCPLLFAVLAARGEDVAAVIARARAALGTDDAINQVQSVHYTGTAEVVEAAAAKDAKPSRYTLDVIFQKPYRQLEAITSDGASGPVRTETTGLNGFEAWQRLDEKTNPPTPYRWALLPADQIRRLRAITWANLGFYHDLEVAGVTIEDGGETVLDGQPCRKLTFNHGDGIFFTRYFDLKSGLLLLTEIENGTSIREVGSVIVNGLRFPQKVVTVNQPKGKLESTMTIVFDKITVNETFDPARFSVPMGK